ncbi:MAG: hypothetical protein HQ567_01235 [Candidatus Nealsonbacteria bacterium]|nr:hypothetical protein [Candidatus Nealsonbacteria bacterium]
MLLREGPCKYIRTLEEGENEELYDVRTDPQELQNLVGDKAHRARLLAMRGNLVAELRRTGAPFIAEMPEPHEFPAPGTQSPTTFFPDTGLLTL